MWFAGPARRAPDAGRPSVLRPGFDLRPGMRVGLYGGSFNPVHSGHLHVARTAMRRLGLDRVIWLVSPQNPLKQTGETESLAARMAAVRKVANIPGMIVSDIETRIGSAYTIDTLRVLKARFPGVHFVWLMGADNLAQFHRWRGWTEILHEVPMAIIARPGSQLSSRFSPAAHRFSSFRLPAEAAPTLPGRGPPAWIYLPVPLNHLSSTLLREEARRARLAAE
jgi:nicotinate-nucleotide adenylyltransferase